MSEVQREKGYSYLRHLPEKGPDLASKYIVIS